MASPSRPTASKHSSETGPNASPNQPNRPTCSITKRPCPHQLSTKIANVIGNIINAEDSLAAIKRPLSRPYNVGFDPERLIKSGALDDPLNGHPSTLINDIHPVFGREHWHGITDAIYEALTPGIRLASMFLTSRACAQYWVTLLYGKREPDDEMSHHEVIKEWVPVTEKKHSAFVEHLEFVATHAELARFSFQEDLRISSQPMSAICGYKSYATLEPGRGCNISEIYFDTDWLVIASRIAESKYPKPENILRFNFYLAVVLLHEMAHCLEMHWKCDKASHVSMKHEVYLPQGPRAECGEAWEAWAFGGRVWPINHDLSFNSGLCIQNWPQPEKFDSEDDIWPFHAISVAYVSKIQQQSYWIWIGNRAELLKVPRDGEIAHFHAQVTTQTKQDVIQELWMAVLDTFDEADEARTLKKSRLNKSNRTAAIVQAPLNETIQKRLARLVGKTTNWKETVETLRSLGIVVELPENEDDQSDPKKIAFVVRRCSVPNRIVGPDGEITSPVSSLYKIISSFVSSVAPAGPSLRRRRYIVRYPPNLRPGKRLEYWAVERHGQLERARFGIGPRKTSDRTRSRKEKHEKAVKAKKLWDAWREKYHGREFDHDAQAELHELERFAGEKVEEQELALIYARAQEQKCNQLNRKSLSDLYHKIMAMGTRVKAWIEELEAAIAHPLFPPEGVESLQFTLAETRMVARTLEYDLSHVARASERVSEHFVELDERDKLLAWMDQIDQIILQQRSELNKLSEQVVMDHEMGIVSQALDLIF
ncbi:hypothetical protein MMC25_006656 [Agyrium rufum]|nr:hypothetical protein [Agyrium rufum]